MFRTSFKSLGGPGSVISGLAFRGLSVILNETVFFSNSLQRGRFLAS